MISKNTQKNIRTYTIKESCIFKKNMDEFGNLSNMAAFKLTVNEITIRTSETLYQACKFSDYPDLQKKIIEQKSPMTAKYVSRMYKNNIRSDWEKIKIQVMNWCLRVKLAQHFIDFGCTLESTGHKNIVEDSKTDDFWGAIKQKNNRYVGVNALGRLLMELRKEYFSSNKYNLLYVHRPRITNFKLCGKQINDIDERINFLYLLVNEIFLFNEMQINDIKFNMPTDKKRILESAYHDNYIYQTDGNIDEKLIGILKTGDYTSHQIIEKGNFNISASKLSKYLRTKKYVYVINKKPLRFKLSLNDNYEQISLPI